ncbi:protocadherin beta-13 [Elysia marginata]|uniref:Protocadherin beta-13 n=1 Tax=Elysia marginata TaxID=1093978 RepID=A0AAV4H0M2_9GAST|nr:protocadherin beta-13 [Elysia marginata]
MHLPIDFIPKDLGPTISLVTWALPGRMEMSFINSAVTVWAMWSINVATTKQICKPKTNLIHTSDCPSACYRDPASTLCRNLCDCSGPANETCTSLDSTPREVAENATEGTPLFQITASSAEAWEYRLGRTESVDGTPLLELQSYFKLMRFANKYELVLNQPLDIESIYNAYGLNLKSLLLRLTCTLESTGNSETTEILLNIKPVNEFAPEFSEPLEINIAEDVKVGNPVVMLRLLATDKDVNPSGTELAYFRLWRYLSDAPLDGSTYFVMTDTREGLIELKKALDYETLRPLGATSLYLNVSASDVHGLTTFSILTTHVGDVDDLPPEFYYRGCQRLAFRSQPCVVAYEGEVFINYQVRNDEVIEKFTINKTNGQISLVSPFNKSQTVRLVIVAMQASGNALTRFARASLKVSIVHGPGHTNIAMLQPPPTIDFEDLSADDDQKETPLYVIATLGVGLLFLLVHCIAHMLCLKYKRDNRSRVNPLPPPEVGDNSAILKYNNRGSVTNLSTCSKPQSRSMPDPTCFSQHGSEYFLTLDGTVSYVTGSLKRDLKIDENLPPMNGGAVDSDTHMFSHAEIPSNRSLSKKSKFHKNSALSGYHRALLQKENSETRNEVLINPLSQPINDDNYLELFGSSSSNLSSLSSDIRIDSPLVSDGETKILPNTCNSQLWNDAASSENNFLLTRKEQDPVPTQYEPDSRESQNKADLHTPGEVKFCTSSLHVSKLPESTTSVTNASKAPNSCGKKKWQGNSGFNAPRGEPSHGVLQDERHAAHVATKNSKTGIHPGHDDSISHTEPNPTSEKMNPHILDELVNQELHRPNVQRTKRKTKKKKLKVDKTGIRDKQWNLPNDIAAGDSLNFDHAGGYESVLNEKVDIEQIVHRCNDPCVTYNGVEFEHYGSVEHYGLLNRMKKPLLCKSFAMSEARSQHSSLESYHRTAIPELRISLPPRAVSSLPYSLYTRAIPNRSSLQPPMDLQYERQREIILHQQQKQQRQIQKNHYEDSHQKQEMYPTPSPAMNMDTQEQHVLRVHKQLRKIKQQKQQQQHQHKKSAEQNNNMTQHPLQQEEVPQTKLRNGHQNPRSASQPCAASKNKEDVHPLPVPGTAPPVLASKDARKRSDDSKDQEENVRNWVNTTH